MKTADRVRVGILRGGPSSEYEISLQTGSFLREQLPEEFQGVDVFIDRSGIWHSGGVARTPTRIFPMVDVFLNALHGEYGEDGRIQHLLQEHRIPCSGSDRLSSAIAMNKALAKRVAIGAGIKTPYFKVLRRGETPELHELALSLHNAFAYPMVVKPADRGSSLGVSLVRSPEDMLYALKLAFSVSDCVLAEEYIEGVEVVSAVIEGFRGEKLYSLFPAVVSLPPNSSFFDYSAKYGGESIFHAQGPLAGETRRELQDVAKRIHSQIGLRDYSASDFIVHPRRGIFFLEVDSIPTLTPLSPLFAALKNTGVALGDFLRHIIALARGRK